MKQLEDILLLLKQLRDKDSGCKWCQQQDFVSLNKYIFEEAHELRQAVAQNDVEAIKHELADILFQPLFCAQIASEQGDFNFTDIVDILKQKLQQRTEGYQQENRWHEIKHEQSRHSSILDSIESSLPATIRSAKIQTRAANVGFDWTETQQIIDTLKEEVAELEEAIQDKHTQHDIHKELGDIVFTCVNLAIHLGTDIDYTLNLTNGKFIKRFQYIEKRLQFLNLEFKDLNFQQMLDYWNEAKEHAN